MVLCKTTIGAVFSRCAIRDVRRFSPFRELVCADLQENDADIRRSLRHIHTTY